MWNIWVIYYVTQTACISYPNETFLKHILVPSGIPRVGGVFKQPPPPEIPKALQSRAKLNPIVKTVKNCWI